MKYYSIAVRFDVDAQLSPDALRLIEISVYGARCSLQTDGAPL